MDSPQAQQMMGKLLPYIPTILSLLSSAPAILFGLLVTCIWYFCFVGLSTFREQVGPVAGFHVMSLILLKRLWKRWEEGQHAAAAVRARKESVRNFAKDIKLMTHGPKLD